MRPGIALGTTVALFGCGPSPVAVDPDSAKTVDLVVHMEPIVGAIPGLNDAFDFTNAAGGWAVYADESPVGYFSFDQPVTLQVPARARTLSLNLEEHRFSGRNPLSELLNGPAPREGLTNISAYPAGSRINVTCNFRYVQGLKSAIEGSGPGLITCAIG